MQYLGQALAIGIAGNVIVAVFGANVGWGWVGESLREFVAVFPYVGLPIIVIGLTRGWWWARLVSLWRKVPMAERDRFKAMYPAIKEEADSMHWTSTFGRFFRPTTERDIAHADLLDALEELSIAYPTPLRYDFLIQLASLSRKGKVEDARTLLDRLNPPTKDLTAPAV